MEASHAPSLRRLGSILILAALGACSGKGSNAPAAAPAALQSGAVQTGSVKPPMAQTASNEFHYDDPCSLLEPKEVEVALGAALGTPPYRGSNVNAAPDGPDCIYQTSDFRQITVNVTFREGSQAYRTLNLTKKLLSNAPSEQAKQAFKMDDGSELAGEWDEASLMAMNCCIFMALRGDQLITVDFTDSDASLRQVGALVDAAFNRIDKPLDLDGGANVAAAKVFLKNRPAEVNPCTLLSRAEVEAILGPLAGPATARGTSQCQYALTPKNGMPRSAELAFDWRLGNAAFRSDAHVRGLAFMALGVKGKPQEEPHLAPAAPGDPWERGGQFDNNFVAIKKDVRIQIDERGGIDPSQAKALVAAAMGKI
jgi:hypothetical protein